MTKQLIVRLISITSLLFSPVSSPAEDPQAVQELVIPHHVETTDHIHSYVVQVLTQTLQVTANEHGPFKLIAQEASTVQSRQLRNLKKGLIDVAWMISSTQRDVEAKAVHIPLIGGLYGYRVLLVKNQSPSPRTLSELRKLTYTQGRDWPDLEILRANQLTVKPSPYKAGFRLVRDGFVDAYPRAAHEAILELQHGITRDLSIAPDILLEYDNPLFFYVADANVVLAERLRQGLTTLINSGELQRLLQDQPFYRAAVKIMHGRSTLELTNPYLSVQAKEAMTHYLDHSEALSYAADTSSASPCKDDKQPRQC